MKLPDAEELIGLVRQHGPGVLDQYAPAIDELVNTPTIADRLKIKTATIYRERSRYGGSGARWPEPEPVPGRSPFWKWRDVIVYRASRPGPGNWSADYERGLAERDEAIREAVAESADLGQLVAALARITGDELVPAGD